MGTLDRSLPKQYDLDKADGDRLVEEGNFAEAKLKLEAALESLEGYFEAEHDLITGRLFDANRGLMEDFLERAKAKREAGDEDAAGELFQEALEAAPDQTARDRVRLAMQEGKPGGEARDVPLSAHLRNLYEQASKTPDDPDPIYNFAVELALDGYLDAAADQFEKVVELTAEKPDAQAVAYFRLANVYMDLERSSDAQEAYLQAKELGYDLADVQYRLGTLYDWENDHAKAREAYLACLEANAEHLGALGALGLLLEHEEDPEGALEQYGKLVELDPEDDEVLFKMGELYLALERSDEAISAFERVVAVDPEGEFAEDAREQLEQLR